jgi:hypothetical protein
MKSDNQTWYLKETCPSCEQATAVFVICPSCKFLTVQCVETGKLYANPKLLEGGFTGLCPKCFKVNPEEFQLASCENILYAGFTKEEYSVYRK